jgi:hypothetical protein
MLGSVRRLVVTLLIVCLGFSTPRPARADIAYTRDGKAIGVIVAVVAVAAVVTFGVYYAMHRNRSLKGCAVGSAGGLELTKEGTQESYRLIGEIQGIKSGDRVHVSGKNVKDESKGKSFIVTKLAKDYGACRVS